MKIIHLVAGSLGGGAARAAVELHDGLLAAGVDTHLVHSHGGSVGANATGLESGTGRKLARFARTTLDRGVSRALSRGGDGRAFSAGLFGADLNRWAAWADVLHLHWINDGGFRLPRMAAIAKPVVWTFHDMWPFTGGCHYAFDCNAFEAGGTCAPCPALGGRETTRVLLSIKARSVRASRVRGVAVSEWLAGQARRSAAFEGLDVVSIPNTVDTDQMWPVPKSVARSALGLDPARPVVLVGHGSSSFQKGADLLAGALAELRDRSVQFDLVGFGKHDADLGDEYAQHFGYVHDTPTLRMLFSAADVFAFPSRTEAFGRTIIEAFACGTPVVAFAGSGPDEIVVDGRTGVLAPKGDMSAFAAGISHVIDHGGKMAGAARDRAETVYSKPAIAGRYVDLYDAMLSQRDQTPPSAIGRGR